MDRKRTVTRTPAPIFSLKKPRMAVFAHPSNLSFGQNQEPSLSDFRPRCPAAAASTAATCSTPGQMNPVRYGSMQNRMSSQSSMRIGQQFEPRVQESPCWSQSSTRTPLFQPRQNATSFQLRSAVAGGRNPAQCYPPPTTGSRFPAQPPRLNPAAPLVESLDYNARSNSSRSSNYRDKLTKVADASETWRAPTRPGVDATPKFAVERKTPDTSLRLVTTTIEGMKRWASLRDKPPLVFEVFGAVNSAVSVDPTKDSIEFLLKDSQATVNCIFYQIDRTLQRLTRGQWYRCVGRYDGTSGASFKCVSIRPAKEAEKKHMKTLVAAADKALQALLQKSREM